MNTRPFLNDLFDFIDKARISGTLSFPFRSSPYDPNTPLANRIWDTVELTDKLIDNLPEGEFELVAIEKAEQTLGFINLDVFNSAKNTVTALDRYLSAIREIDTRSEYLKKAVTEQDIIFNNRDDVQLAPPGNIENLEFTHYTALVEFLKTKVLMWLRQNIEDYVTVLKLTSKYSEFFNLLNEKMDIKKGTTQLIIPEIPLMRFEDAAANDNDLQMMIKILLNKKVIDSQSNLTSTATLLYSLIKRFRQLGYFKKTTMKDLHPMVNTAFKASASYQLFKQTDPYLKPLD